MSVWDDLSAGGNSTWGFGDDSGFDPGSSGNLGSLNSSGSSTMGSIAGVGAGLGAIGAAGSLIGGLEASKYQSQAYSDEINIAGLDMQVNQQREQQMLLTSQRQNIENLRNVQKTQAMGRASAVNSGAQFGSGLAGAQSEAAARGGMNTLANNQNTQIGKSIFDLTNQMDMQKINIAQSLSSANSWQGFSSALGGLGQLGQGIMQAAGPLSMML